MSAPPPPPPPPGSNSNSSPPFRPQAGENASTTTTAGWYGAGSTNQQPDARLPSHYQQQQQLPIGYWTPEMQSQYAQQLMYYNMMYQQAQAGWMGSVQHPGMPQQLAPPGFQMMLSQQRQQQNTSHLTYQSSQQHRQEQVLPPQNSLSNSLASIPSSGLPTQSNHPRHVATVNNGAKKRGLPAPPKALKKRTNSLEPPPQRPQLGPQELEKMEEWANDLLDRDWEIYWDQTAEEDVDMKVESSLKNNEKKTGDSGDDSGEEFVDDWYAGRIVSVAVKPDGSVLAKTIFVGDEDVYDMELTPNIVRPSARGWIKRTNALLRGESIKEDYLPPDTATPEDRKHLQHTHAPVLQYEALSLPPKTGIQVPSLEELCQIVDLREKLRAQVYLRSKLATIVNHHGSIKFIDGEPNPTEPLVNHLVECCQDVERACAWYLKCWELLTICFVKKSGQSSNESEIQKECTLNYDAFIEEYVEFGKNCLLNCATMDIASTTSKRRQLTPSSGQRRPKRRRRNSIWTRAGDIQLEAFAEEDFRSSVSVSQFAARLNNHSVWYIPIFSKMIHALSHYVIHPLVHWRHKANLLLDNKDDLAGILDDDVTETLHKKSKDLGQEGDDSSVESIDVEQHQIFSYEDVVACLNELARNSVLSLLDISNVEPALQMKLEDLESISTEADSLLKRLAENSTAPAAGMQTNGDPVLEGLKGLIANIRSPGNSAYNIDPIGKGDFPITLEIIECAAAWREWLLDVQHAMVERERISFVCDLGKRMQQLKNLPCLDLGERQTEAENHVHKMLSEIVPLSDVEKKYYDALLHHDASQTELFSKDGIKKALVELEQLPYLLVAEEKLLLRLSLIEWSEDALNSMPQNGPVRFEQLERLHETYQLLLRGQSKTRNGRTSRLRACEKIEGRVKIFIEKDVHLVDSSACATEVVRLYHASSVWKQRAETIISSLRMHGNTSVGGSVPNQKLPAMVDIKRINDLVSEYSGLGVEVPEYTSALQNVISDSQDWFSRLEIGLMDESLTVSDTLDGLVKQSKLRPKGLIMDPTRQVVDTLIELLQWYQRSKEKWAAVRACLQGKNAPAGTLSLFETAIYPNFAEGIEIIELFSHGVETKHKVISKNSSHDLEACFSIRPSARALSRDKIETHPFGKAVLARLVKAEIDNREGSPLLMYVWADWYLSVASFVTTADNSVGGKTQIRSLSRALDFVASQPQEPQIVGLNSLGLEHVARLETLIGEAQTTEIAIRDLILKSRELRKGCWAKQDEVRIHLAALKDFNSEFKNRASGKQGLSLDPEVEVILEQHIRIFSWMVRALAFPWLYKDETSYATFNESGEMNDARIPWDVLVPLCDRIPSENDGVIDDFALVGLRVRELYQKAKAWQDEITRCTLLSNRGGKRRGPSSSPAKGEQDVEATTTKLQMEKIQVLVDDPVLSKVAMPREAAVKSVFWNSKEFEVQLHAFLRKDFDGPNADRCAYPDSRSLVGKNGQFILYRLTGGPIFDSVLQSVEELSTMADNVFAETPEKKTFEWIRRAVKWIEDLSEAVAEESPFGKGSKMPLSIPEDRARALYRSGLQTFPDVSEDVKKTLSQHGIFVSAKKTDHSLRVALKKDGAHHSIGGTTIRWCPILFNCLRADVARLDEWRAEIQNLVADWKAFNAESGAQNNNNNNNNTENDLYKWYCLQNRTSTLLSCGKDLVVSPMPSFVQRLNELLVAISNRYAEKATPEMDVKFAKMWFMEKTSTVDQRHVVLEALLYRRSIDSVKVEVDLTTDINRNFRVACRELLTAIFTKAVKAIGMNELDDRFSVELLDGFIAVRTWEIENKMFDKFQQDFGETKVSDEYRRKARNLKASLEDKGNLSLCLEILLGETSAEKVVSMSSDELASQTLKIARARAEADARAATTLSVGTGPDDPSQKTSREGPKSPDKKPDVVGKPKSILRLSTAISARTTVVNDANAGGSTHGNATLPGGAGANISKQEKTASDSDHFVDSEKDLSLALATRLEASRSSRPPPPPSLLNAFQSNIDSDDEDIEVGQPISGISGSDRFFFEFSHPRVSFTASLFLEDSSLLEIDRFLPDSFAEKGRLRDSAFTSFVAEKAAGRRWVAIPLRLVPSSDHDSRDLDRFVQEFEAMDRISMLAVGSISNTKMFVVTPGFHQAAIQTGVISFACKSASYAVVLTKDTRKF